MAKKRYYQSTKDRLAESRGMERRYFNDDYDHRPDKFNDSERHDKDGKMGDMGFDTTIARRANMNEFYAGMDARRRQELEDSGMINEDPRAIANLPQEVMIKAYPKLNNYLPEGIDDTGRGVDMQMDYDDDKRTARMYPKKV